MKLREIKSGRLKTGNIAKYYAIRRGRIEGVYRSWKSCRAQVHRFKEAEYKSLGSEEAWIYIAS